MTSTRRTLAMLMAVCTLLSMVCIGFGTQTVSAAVDTSAMPQLQLEVRQSVTIDDNTPEAFLVFVPTEDGYYQFTSFSGKDTYGKIYDTDMNQLASDDDNGSGMNFRVGYQMTAGETYILGARMYSDGKATFDVVIQTTPVASIEVAPITVYEGMHGYTSSYWDDNLFQMVYFFVYRWIDQATVKVTFKDGTVATGTSGVSVGDSWYGFQGLDDQHGGNQWLPGNTYTGTVSLMGVSATAQITVEESPVERVEIDPIMLKENEDGWWTSGYDSSTGQYQEYYQYSWNSQVSGYVILKDGQKLRINNGGVGYQDSWYSVATSDNQTYENRMLPGNTYVGMATIFGKTTEVPLTVVSPIHTDGYQYILQNGMAIITDCYATNEQLVIPKTLDGYPVVGIQSLGSALGTAVEITIGNHITMLSQKAFTPTDWEWSRNGIAMSVLSLGSGVSNLDVAMFKNAKNLERIYITSDNPNYCVVDNVVYDKNCTRMVMFPPMKSTLHVVPDSVTDVSIIFENASLFTNANIQLGAGVEDYVTVDGVTYNKDMTAVYKCNSNKTGSYVMPETVQEIKNNAFAGNNLTEITLSSLVTEIVYGAFYRSTKLEKVNMPEGLRSIGFQAFWGCTALKTVQMPASVNYVDYSAFNNCTALESVYISDLTAWCNTYFCGNTSNPLYYAGDLYLNGEKITKLVIPENVVETVYDNTFCNGNFTEVVIPGTVRVIGYDAFNGATMAKITLGEGIEEIWSGAFENSKLQSVKLPDSLQVLESYAFNNCVDMTSAVLGKGIREIPGHAFANTALKKIILPANIESVGWSAFANASLTEVVFENDAVQVDYRAFYNCPLLEIDLGDKVGYIGDQAFQGSHAYQVEIPDAVTEITYRTFAFNYNLTSVTIGENVNLIDICAFEGDSNLTHVLYKGNRMQWEEVSIYCDVIQNATVHCNANGKEITYNNTCTHIAYFCSVCNQHFAAKKVKSTHTFDGDICTICGHSGLWDYNVNADGKSVTIIGYLGEEKKIEIPATLAGLPVTAIGDGAFVSAKLTEVTVPEGVTHIGSRAFDGSMVSTLNLPKSLTTIGSYAFRSTKQLQKVVLPEGVTILEEGAFYQSGISQIELPRNMTVIGDKAFASCSWLSKVEMPETLNSLGQEVFWNCYNLEQIVIPEGIQEIQRRSFQECYNLKSVKLPSTVTEISYFAFHYCEELEQVALPESVQIIRDNAFNGCYSLETIGFRGDAPQIQQWAFDGVSAVAIYRAGNTTWNEDTCLDYGGNLSWDSCDTPVITCQPFDARANENEKALTVIMSTGNYVVQQWFCAEPGSDVFNPTTTYGNSFERVMTDETNGTRVYCVLTNILGDTVTSGVATLRMNPKVTGIRITQLPYTVEYSVGQPLRTRGLEILATYSDGTEKLMTEYTVDGYDPMKSGEQVITVTCGKFTEKFTVTVKSDMQYLGAQNENISVQAPEGAIDGEVQLKAEKVELAQKLPELPSVLEKSEYVAFNIYMERNETLYQPAKAVVVSVPVPENMRAQSCQVYHVADDGTAENMRAYYNDGCMVFYTDHFSYYAIVETAGVTVSGTITDPSGASAIRVSLLSGNEVLETQTVTGSYSFRNLAEGTYTIRAEVDELPAKTYEIQVGTEDLNQDILLAILGDMTDDQVLNVDDAMYLLQHILMAEMFPVSQNADVNKDGQSNVDDVIYLLQHVLMPELFPL